MSTGRERSERGGCARASLAEPSFVLPERSQVAFLDSYEMLCELELCKHALDLRNEDLRTVEFELQASRQRYRDWFRSAPVAYLVIGSARVVDANDAAAELLEVRAADLVGTRLSRFVAQEDRAAFRRYRTRLGRGVERAATELSLVRASGERLDVRVESARMAGGERQWRTALIDLTREKRLQRKLDEARRADALGPVTRELAHEIGHLLMGMLGGAERVLVELPSDHPARELVAELKRAALRGGAMTEHILERAGRGSAPAESALLDAAIGEHQGALAQLCPEGVALVFALAAADVRVPVHAIDLHRILVNLVTNACAAMPRGGTIRVATRAAAPRFDGDDLTFTIVEVSDTGEGFSASARARLEEPCFSTKPAGAAGGAGLPIVQAIVQRAGGHVRIESVPGGGTTMLVHLPIAPSAA
jgi:PAS domain S-box-containing protein